MFIKYQYQKFIDLCGNFTIYTYTYGRWQKNIHRIIKDNRNTMEHKNIQNRSVSYIQSIGAYFKCIINITAKCLQQTNIIRNSFKHKTSFPVHGMNFFLRFKYKLHSRTKWYSSSKVVHTWNILSEMGVWMGLCHFPVSIHNLCDI